MISRLEIARSHRLAEGLNIDQQHVRRVWLHCPKICQHLFPFDGSFGKSCTNFFSYKRAFYHPLVDISFFLAC